MVTFLPSFLPSFLFSTHQMHTCLFVCLFVFPFFYFIFRVFQARMALGEEQEIRLACYRFLLISNPNKSK